MNILYVGSIGTSGYAIATKNSIFNLLMNGFNVTFHPIQVDNSLQQYDIISSEVEKCINKKYDFYDKLIIELVPQELIITKINESYNLIRNAGYHFSWCYNVENKILSFAHQEDNTPERYQMVRDRVKRLENTKLINDLPEFLYQNYSKYIYNI